MLFDFPAHASTALFNRIRLVAGSALVLLGQDPQNGLNGAKITLRIYLFVEPLLAVMAVTNPAAALDAEASPLQLARPSVTMIRKG